MRSLFNKPIIQLILAISFILQTPVIAAYDQEIERRVSIGLGLFRTLLSTDQNLAKKVNSQHQLNLLLVTAGHPEKSQLIADKLISSGRGSEKSKILGIPINIIIADIKQIQNAQYPVLAGIYLTDKLTDQQLDWTINLGISQQAIVYSPFEGDVEKGVPTGLSVGIRVIPYINVKALKKFQITIKSLVFKIAKIYED